MTVGVGQRRAKRIVFAAQAGDGVGQLVLRRGEHGGNLGVGTHAGAVVGDRRAAAEQADARSALVRLGAKHFDESDLSGGAHVRRAAGAEIVTVDLHKAQIFADLDLTSVNERRRFFFGREKGADRQILCHRFVGARLDLLQLLGRERQTRVDGHLVLAEMKADVFDAVELVRDPRKEMLAAVALHPVKAQRKIHFAAHGLADRQRRLGAVYDFAVFFLRVKDAGAVQRSAVAALSAPLGEESGAVEPHGVTAPLRRAGGDGRFKMKEESILIIQSFGHGPASVFSIVAQPPPRGKSPRRGRA